METTTVKISKKHSEMLDSLLIKLEIGEKKRLLEGMIEYFTRYPFKPKEAYSTIDDKLYHIESQCRDIKDELREMKKELKKDKKE